MLLASRDVCHARTVSIAVDISGSHRAPTALGRESAVSALVSVLNGQPLSSQWRAIGQDIALRQFALQPGDRVCLLPFGNIRSADPPFFRAPDCFSDVNELRSRFPLTASAFTESKTNKTLAEVVAARLASQSTQDALVIMLSDFLVDSSLSPAQIAHVNEAQSKFSVQVVSTLSWSQNARVQIKMISTPQRWS